MKKVFRIIVLLINLALIISGITCLIVANLVKGTVYYFDGLYLYGFTGIGSAVSTLLIIVANSFLKEKDNE